jgi:hypothetical protein
MVLSPRVRDGQSHLWCVLRTSARRIALTVNSDTPTLVAHSDKGKPVERRGRKATGLRA